MKNILLLVHDDSGQEARLQVALDLTRGLGGHLRCVDVTALPPVVGATYDGSDIMVREIDREAANRVTLERRLRHEDVAWDWIDCTGEPITCVTREATLADLIVVNRALDHGSTLNARRVTSELVVKSGKPILAVPPALRRFDWNGALIAWDGSSAAAAALRAAVPLIRLAQEVTIAEFDDGSVHTPAEEAASYLSRHDVHARVERTRGRPGQAAALLLDRIGRGSFGYVVMGGFGYRRWREALFGGVTQTLLTKSPLPLFLAH